MLSIGKLAAGQERYYEQQVANGLDDYFTGRGEAPGRWLGAGARELGLVGTVEDGQLSSLMAGLDPGTGRVLRGKDVQVAALDLTFSAPKSISVLFAVGSERIQQELVRAHEEAVEASLSYLEETAVFVRRGKGGHRFEHGAGLVVAAFRHRMSRALDPQLHTHCIAANMARGQDGRWTALHHPSLYQAALTAGYLYQAHLRALVHERLALQWGEVRTGMAELQAVPEQVLGEFSRRRHEMEREAAAGGLALDSKARGQAAALATRERKQYGIETHTFQQECRARAAEHGLDGAARRRIERVALKSLAREVPVRSEAPPREVSALYDYLASPNGLTEKRNAVGARDVLRAIAEAATQGAPIETVRDRGREFGRRADVLKTKGLELTTAELVGVEDRLIAAAQGRAGEGAGRVERRAVEASLALCERELTAEQRQAVEATVSSGHGVQVIEALAGTGKTHTAGVLRYVYERAGYQVVGIAPTGRAVRELAEHAGIPSRTLAAVVGQLREGVELPRGCVVILDEAGMAGTRETAALFAAAQRAGAKVIAIGDPGQLHSVQAGGWMRAVGRRVGVLKLSEVMRQHDLDERRALARLHEGVPRGWLSWARDHERVSVGSQREQLVAAIGQWAAAASEHGLSQAVLIVRSNDLRRVLNELAREHVRELGCLRAQCRYGPVEVAVGDRVICRRNDRLVDVDNGTRGTVRVALEDRVVIETDAGSVRELPAWYVAEHVEHAYALTGHGVQGATVRWAGVVASPHELTRGWSYTALSRAQETTLLFVLSEAEGWVHHELAGREEIAPEERGEVPSDGDVLTRVAKYMLERDDEDLAVESLAPELGAGRAAGRELAAGQQAQGAPQQNQGAERAEQRYQPATSEHVRQHTEQIDRLRSQLLALSGNEVHRLESLERQEIQLLAAEQVAVARLAELPAKPRLRRDPDQHARANLQIQLEGTRARLDGVRQLQARLEQEVGSLAEIRAERDGVQAALNQAEGEREGVLRELTAETVQHPPQWAVRALGQPREQKEKRRIYEEAIERALRYRVQHRVEDRVSALGVPPPEGTGESGEHTRASLALKRAREQLTPAHAIASAEGLPRRWTELLGPERAGQLEQPLHAAREQAANLPDAQLEEDTKAGKLAFGHLDQTVANQTSRLEREHAEHAERARRQTEDAERLRQQARGLGFRRRHERDQLIFQAQAAQARADRQHADIARIELALDRMRESGNHPDQWIQQHAPTAIRGLAARDELDHRRQLEVEHEAERAIIQPPAHLRELIGEPPVSGVKLNRQWEELAQALEHHRLEHLIDVDRDGPLGPDPSRITSAQRSEYERGRQQLAAEVEQLRHDRGLEPHPQVREIVERHPERERELELGPELDR